MDQEINTELEKQPEVTVKEPNTNKNQVSQLAGAVLIAGVFIAGAILLKGSTPPVKNAPVDAKNLGANTETIVSDPRPVSAEDHILGNPNAEVLIVEYSDTECPFCKKFHYTMHTVIAENNGKVAWVYRHFPITERHPRSAYQAEALECAGELGGNDGFWKFNDELYARTNSNNSLLDEELPKIAKFVGLNESSFNNCLNSGKYQAKVFSDLEDGAKSGVQGTPHSFIIKNGKVVDIIPGAQPIEVVRAKISQALGN